MDFSGMLRPAVRDGWDAEQCAFIGTINHRTFMYMHNRIQCTYMYLRMMYTNLGLGFGASPCFLQQNLRWLSIWTEHLSIHITFEKSSPIYCQAHMPAVFVYSHLERADSRHYHEMSIPELTGTGELSARISCSHVAWEDDVAALPSFYHQRASVLRQSP